MLITNGDKLKHHFKNVVDVKYFTPEQICTIIDTFSIDIPEDAKLVMPRHLGIQMVCENIERIMSFKTTKICEAESEGHEDD